jgi:hypothetical protein
MVPLGHNARTLAPPRVLPEDERKKPPILTLGMLPLARRDVERLRQILSMQRRLTDPNLSPRARRALTHKSSFAESMTWLEIHGEEPEVLEHWKGFIEAAGIEPPPADEGPRPCRRRRRRRRGPPRSTT